MTHKLINNGMYRKEQFVLLGVDGRGTSERMISELGLSGIKKCYRCGVGVGGAECEGIGSPGRGNSMGKGTET